MTDKLADEVESRNRVYVERDALRARVAELERELGMPGPTNHDETPLRARLAEAESRALSLAAEASALREALRAVEWIAVASDGAPSCLNCAYALYAGHSKACVVGKALAAPSSAAAVLSARDNETRRVALEEAARIAEVGASNQEAWDWSKLPSIIRSIVATSPTSAPPARVRDLDWHLEPEDLAATSPVAATPAATYSNPTCAKCGKHLVRGPIGGGHFDWLECCVEKVPR